MEQFNHFYEQNSHPELAESLLSFFNDFVLPRFSSNEIRVLDLGAGNLSIFEKTSVHHNLITAIDFSPVAISQKPVNSHIHYDVRDVTSSDFPYAGEFNLVFDSHCLHCITGEKQREAAFKNIRQALKNDGFFCAEMMVQPIGKTVNLPFKFIPTARELEDELVRCGFKIQYFIIGANLNFHNRNGECDLVRIIAKK